MEDCAEENDSSSPSSLVHKPRPLTYNNLPLEEATDTASHSCKFKFMKNNTGGKRKLISDKFVAGGYEWAIDFYPNGTRSEDDQYISLFITLESMSSDVIARFELILVDQSRKEKHRIQTNFGMHAPSLMKHQGSQWGFRRFIKKSQLQKSYLKDDYLIVKCRVVVLDVCEESESYSALALDQVQDLEPIHSALAVDQVQDFEPIDSPLAADQVQDFEPTDSPLAADQVQDFEPIDSPLAADQVQDFEPTDSPLAANQVQDFEPTDSPLAVDQVQDLVPIYSPSSVEQIEESEDYNLKDAKVRTALNIIFDTGLGVNFDGENDKFDQYLHAVDEIQELIKLGTISDYETKGVDLVQMITERLLAEFRNISDWSINTVEADDISSTDGSSWIATSCSQEILEGDHIGYGALSAEQIYRLRCITERLNSTGRLQECIEVYNISRKTLVHASLFRLGMGNWGFTDIRSLDRTEFARKIKVWIRASQMCFVIIFPREKQNYETIFDGYEDATYGNCFADIVKDIAIQLCNFAETISTSLASLEKLFDVLDLYKFLLLYLPDIKSTFQSASTICICTEAERILDKLANLIRETLSSFKETVLHEKLNTPISRGTLHFLTRYTMEYVTEMVHYNELLTEIIISHPTMSLIATNEGHFFEVGGRKPLALDLLWIIISLKSNLEVKFKEYKDTNLAHLFLMNNLHYIVEEIKGSSYELVEMIGEDYITKLSKDVLEEARSYLGSWDKVMYCLRDEGLYYKLFYNGISKNTLKERFKSFNSSFEEVLQTQFAWFVPDLELRNQLRDMIRSKLIPAYKSFLDKFSIHMENERHKERYIKYSTEELENKIQFMFIEQWPSKMA